MEHANARPGDGSAPVAEETPEQHVARARAEGNPWALAAGIFPDDDLTGAWVEAMRENRRKDDVTEAVPIGHPDDPARRFASIHRDNPLYEQWQETMREFRRRADRPTKAG